VVEGPHVVEPVTQLHEQHPQVLGHRHDHLAEALGLSVLPGAEVDVVQLGEAIHQPRDLRTEMARDIAERRVRVFDDVVQQARADARRVQPQVGDDPCYTRWVYEVRLPAPSALVSVRPLRVTVGALDERSIRTGMVRSDALYEGIDGRDHGAAFRKI
jgi:hypothetical protein